MLETAKPGEKEQLCDHPRFVRHLEQGCSDMGDKRCVECGEVFSPSEVKEIEAKRGKYSRQ